MNDSIISIFSEYLDECGLTNSFESFLCSKGLIFEDFAIINKEQQLRKQLLNHIAQLNTTPNQIKERQVKNPFPIGTRSVYVFACGGDISDSHKWKLLVFFEENSTILAE